MANLPSVPVAAAVLLLAACRPGGGPAAGPAAAPPPVPVQVAVAGQRDVPRVLEAVGTLQSLRTVAVKSQVDGVIARIHFEEGGEAKAGDLLVTLDRRPFQNSLRIARADLAQARAEAARAAADLARYQRLDQQEAVSKEQLALLATRAETTRALTQSREAAVANAELLLGYTEIRAPLAGRTGQRLLHEGALVKANDAAQSLVVLNQLAPIAVAFAVPETALAELRAALPRGDAAITVTDRASGLSRSDGRLSFLDQTVDAATGTITVKATFPNADQALWPGQFVQVRLQLGVDRAAVVVPSTAVRPGQAGPQVYVVRPDRSVDVRPVQVQRTAGDDSLIGSGVRPGETVVTGGHLRLLPNSRVQVAGGDAPAAAPAPARP